MMRVNVWPHPRFGVLPNVIDNSGVHCSVSNDAKYGRILKLSRDEGAYKFVSYAFGGLTPGAEYVMSASFWIQPAAGGYDGNSPLNVCDGDGKNTLSTIPSGEDSYAGECRFTAPDDGRVYIKLRMPLNPGVVCHVREPQLELAETYDQAVGGGGIPASSRTTPCHSNRNHRRAGGAR